MTTIDRGDPGRTRRDDHTTSEQGARAVGRRAPNQKVRLLVEYRSAGEAGATDEEAAEAAGLTQHRSTCWWKRCSELRELGLIEQLPIPTTRKGSAGVDRIVCAISPGGLAYLKALGL